jgi:hypothetical protein
MQIIYLVPMFKTRGNPCCSMHTYLIVRTILKKLQSTRGKWLAEFPPPFPHSQIPQFIYGISLTLHLMMGFPKDHALQ